MNYVVIFVFRAVLIGSIFLHANSLILLDETGSFFKRILVRREIDEDRQRILCKFVMISVVSLLR